MNPIKINDKVRVTICKSGGYFDHYRTGVVEKITKFRIAVRIGKNLKYFSPHNVSLY